MLRREAVREWGGGGEGAEAEQKQAALKSWQQHTFPHGSLRPAPAPDRGASVSRAPQIWGGRGTRGSGGGAAVIGRTTESTRRPPPHQPSRSSPPTHTQTTLSHPSHTSLLARWTDAARRHGVPNRGVIAWVRRKIGPDVTVLRVRRDGTLGCATPCILCQRALAAFDMRVSCPPGAAGGGWFSGRLNADDAPPPTLTSGQRRQLGVPADPRKPVGVPGPSRYDGGGRYDGHYPRKPRGPAQPVARLGSDAPAVVAAAASSGSKGKRSPSGVQVAVAAAVAAVAAAGAAEEAGTGAGSKNGAVSVFQPKKCCFTFFLLCVVFFL